MNPLRTVRSFCACLITATVFGCAGASENLEVPPVSMAESGAVQQASASGQTAILFTDKEALRYDAGEMDADVPTEFQTTDSGLRYRILRKSDGQKPTASNHVSVHYRGWLDNGKEFDSSYGGSPADFQLSGVVAGWTEGLQYVGVGGMIELWIPPRLGYGSAGMGGVIPPNAMLHFVVELLNVQ